MAAADDLAIEMTIGAFVDGLVEEVCSDKDAALTEFIEDRNEDLGAQAGTATTLLVENYEIATAAGSFAGTQGDYDTANDEAAFGMSGSIVHLTIEPLSFDVPVLPAGFCEPLVDEAAVNANAIA